MLHFQCLYPKSELMTPPNQATQGTTHLCKNTNSIPKIEPFHLKILVTLIFTEMSMTSVKSKVSHISIIKMMPILTTIQSLPSIPWHQSYVQCPLAFAFTLLFVFSFISISQVREGEKERMKEGEREGRKEERGKEERGEGDNEIENDWWMPCWESN